MIISTLVPKEHQITALAFVQTLRNLSSIVFQNIAGQILDVSSYQVLFTLSIIVSQLEEKITVLSAEVALRSHETAKEHEKKIETEVIEVETEKKEEMEELKKTYCE